MIYSSCCFRCASFFIVCTNLWADSVSPCLTRESLQLRHFHCNSGACDLSQISSCRHHGVALTFCLDTLKGLSRFVVIAACCRLCISWTFPSCQQRIHLSIESCHSHCSTIGLNSRAQLLNIVHFFLMEIILPNSLSHLLCRVWVLWDMRCMLSASIAESNRYILWLSVDLRKVLAVLVVQPGYFSIELMGRWVRNGWVYPTK